MDDPIDSATEWRTECDNWNRYAESHGTLKTIEDLVTALQSARRMMREMTRQLELIKKVVE